MRIGTNRQLNLLERLKQYVRPSVCLTILENARWPMGLMCIRCGSGAVSRFSALGRGGKVRNLYECAACHAQFSAGTGTVLHNSHLSLLGWFIAIHFLREARGNVSAKELQRYLGVSYKTAWYLRKRLTEVMQDASGYLAGLPVYQDDSTRLAGTTPRPDGQPVRESSDTVMIDSIGLGFSKYLGDLIRAGKISRKSITPPVKA
jgi:transposase-like protein